MMETDTEKRGGMREGRRERAQASDPKSPWGKQYRLKDPSVESRGEPEDKQY